MWLSDYEYEPDRNNETEFSGYSQCTSPSSSHVTTPFSSEHTTPFSSRPSTPSYSCSTTPSISFHNDDNDSGLPSETDKSFEDIARPRKKLQRTLSLPDSDLNQIQPQDLEERFATLQLEQENRELKKLTQDLQSALEKLEERVNEMQKFECDSLDDPPPYTSPIPSGTPAFYPNSPEVAQDFSFSKSELPEESIPKKNRRHHKHAKGNTNQKIKSKKLNSEDSSCCLN